LLQHGLPLRWLASAGRRRAFYLFLDKKVAKNQGLELMLDKIVKALFRQHTHPMKDRERTRCLGCGVWKIVAEPLTFSPSIIFYAGEQGGDSGVRK